MRTVKEISDLTGISVRTLHYYDEIGLLKPTEKSDAGYRLYDDKALETLQQVLFFREFDIPLKEIKAVMDNPVLERNQLLQMQRKMLVAKKERMERLITSIDDILKGENKMDFAIFSKTEVEEMFQTMLEHMPDNMKELAIKEFGSVEEWKKHYIEAVSSEEMQKGYRETINANRFDICVAICFNLTANAADRSSKGMFIYIFFINVPQPFQKLLAGKYLLRIFKK